MATLTGKAVSELPNASTMADDAVFAISSGGSSYKISKSTLRDVLPYLKTYDSVMRLGLTVGSATIAAAYAALPVQSIGIFSATNFAANELPQSSQAGSVFMYKSANEGRGLIHAYRNNGEFRMIFNENSVPTEWRAFNSTVTSGSMKDIKGTGVYFVGNDVTNKPTTQGGLFVFTDIYENGTNGVGLYLERGNGQLYTVSVVTSNNVTTWTYALVNDYYKAGDTVSGAFRGFGRVVNAGNALYVTIYLDKPVRATSATMSITTCYMYTSVGAASLDTSRSVAVTVGRNYITAQLPLTQSIAAGAIGIAEINSATITFA